MNDSYIFIEAMAKMYIITNLNSSNYVYIYLNNFSKAMVKCGFVFPMYMIEKVFTNLVNDGKIQFVKTEDFESIYKITSIHVTEKW